MIRCTRSVCFASNGRLVEARRVCCGAGLRDEVSSAQLGNPTSNNIAILRRTLIASPSAANATALVNQLAVIPKKTFQFEPIAIEESPLDLDVIANPKRPEMIDIRPPSIVRERNQDPLSGLTGQS
jgi:hypothetical protein